MSNAQDRNTDLPDSLVRFQSAYPLFMGMVDNAGVPLAAAFHMASSKEQRGEAIHRIKQQYEIEGYGADSPYSKQMMAAAVFLVSFALQQDDIQIAHSVAYMMAKIFDKADDGDLENVECKKSILKTVFWQNILQQSEVYPKHVESNARKLLDVLSQQTSDDIIEQAAPDEIKEELVAALKFRRLPSTIFPAYKRG
ncbi:MAG: hypothetical protein CMH32_04855 [Micavibrio sp.]|nr:hypothetical protein [Micavibrio sp.]HCK32026.1 hypothetical protein [Rhodospirillaceae bacterium]|tara:strand:- start:134 stop:721 length:588 start_codon:yes stop_codon:yes gene_type:complete